MDEQERHDLEFKRIEVVAGIEKAHNLISGYEREIEKLTLSYQSQLRQYLEGLAFRRTVAEEYMHELGKLDQLLGGDSRP